MWWRYGFSRRCISGQSECVDLDQLPPQIPRTEKSGREAEGHDMPFGGTETTIAFKNMTAWAGLRSIRSALRRWQLSHCSTGCALTPTFAFWWFNQGKAWWNFPHEKDIFDMIRSFRYSSVPGTNHTCSCFAFFLQAVLASFSSVFQMSSTSFGLLKVNKLQALTPFSPHTAALGGEAHFVLFPYLDTWAPLHFSLPKSWRTTTRWPGTLNRVKACTHTATPSHQGLWHFKGTHFGTHL